METNYNTPAFPINEETTIGQMGMTMLDYFAAKALQGLICAPYQNMTDFNILAPTAYELAEKMLEERKKYIK